MYFIIEVIIVLGLVALLIVLLVLHSGENATPSRLAPCSESRNFECEFLQKTRDPIFMAALRADPRGVFESEMSAYIGKPYALPPGVNLKVIEEDPKELHLMIPTNVAPSNPGIVNHIVDTLGENKTFGLFMGAYDGIWWRLGIHEGSCIADIKAEVASVKSQPPGCIF